MRPLQQCITDCYNNGRIAENKLIAFYFRSQF